MVEIRNEPAVTLATSIADKDLGREVFSALERNALINSTQAEVGAAEGHVTLSGKVSSPAARRAAEETASRALGATGVTNNIKVVMTA